MRKPTPLVAAAVALLFTHFATPLLAWNDVGHMTVALMAWRQLEEPQRQKLGEILTHHPHYKEFLTEYLPAGVDPNEWAFMRAATWPDWVRPAYPGKPAKPTSITKYHQSVWHYIDAYYVPPADAGKVDTKKLPNSTTLPTTRPNNSLQAIETAMGQLASPDTSPEGRAVALAWVEHIVGDIHQPMHNCSLVSTRFPRGDEGGNQQAVKAEAGGKVVKLHAFWDDTLGFDRAYPLIDKLAKSILSDEKFQPAALPELTTGRTPESWSQEGNALAISNVYLNGKLETAIYSEYQKKTITDADVPTLSAEYVESAHALARRRVALASYRLAEVLKELLR